MRGLFLGFGDQHGQLRNVHLFNQRAVPITFGYIC